jgi:alkanesulfonate monooxygenase SsuD/methylene tetrahydromethanopterin reductase-like flavin-dependent oxidoreductase (luciferase family)
MPLRSIGTVVPAAFATREFGSSDFRRAAHLADEHFDSLWAPDHLLGHFPVVDPFVSLASVALLTERVKLGFGALNIAIRPVALMAKMLASLDHLADGRVVVGVGVGGEIPEEFTLAGVPLAERGRAADVAIAGLRLFFGGTHPDGPIEPRARQGDGLPIWVGGTSPRALVRAAAAGDGWFGAFLTPPGFAKRRAEVERERCRLGLPLEGYAFAQHLAVCLDHEPAAQLERFFAALPTYRRETYERMWVAGPLERAVERIGEYVMAGVEHVILAPPGPNFIRQLEEIATELVPALRDRWG